MSNPHGSQFDRLELPASADFHVHLRDGSIMNAVVPLIRQGGVDLVYVMVRCVALDDAMYKLTRRAKPNLVPPVTTVERALEYQKDLQDLAPNVTFLMSLYLHPSITPEVIVQAKKKGIRGVKSYPAGVTTNSDNGVVDYASFYPVFAEMERQDLVLNLHGECPSGDGVTVHNAEEKFLPVLHELNARFPKLRIVLEHCTTALAIEAVNECGPTVAGTITAHHLFLTSDDWSGESGSVHNYCKPVAKSASDREALLKTAFSGNPKVFLGTDSAPHSVKAKHGGAAGVFTQPYASQLVVDALELGIQEGILQRNKMTKELLEGFLGKFGRSFYQVPASKERISISLGATQEISKFIAVVDSSGDEDSSIIPFRSGNTTCLLKWYEATVS